MRKLYVITLAFPILMGCGQNTESTANLNALEVDSIAIADTSNIKIITDKNFKKYVDTCYDFDPHLIKTDAELKVEFVKADELFKKIENDKEIYFPLLRAELLAEGHKPYFYYDASSLLSNNCNNLKDFEIIYKATLKSDILDCNEFDFLLKIKKFAQRGFNTYKFSEMVLNVKGYKMYLVDHALTLDKDYILLFMLLPIDEKYYVDKLISRLETETDADNQLAIINVLGYCCNCKGDAAIEKFSTKNLKDERLKSRIEIFKSFKHKRQDDAEYKQLINKRNKILSNINDEVLYELDDITKEIKKNYICR
jgi:hypothetical protein